jgi:hypothetical protein
MIMRIRLGWQANGPGAAVRFWSPDDKRLSSGRRLDVRGDRRRIIMSFLSFRGDSIIRFAAVNHILSMIRLRVL